MQYSILLIAPEDGFRAKVAGRLADAGYAVAVEADSDDAVRQLADKGADVVLLAASGSSDKDLALLQRLMDAAPRAKIILLERGGDVDFVMEAKRRGVFDDILIPFEIRQLIQRIAAATDSRRPRG